MRLLVSGIRRDLAVGDLAFFFGRAKPDALD
jgi:hypothetical protein